MTYQILDHGRVHSTHATRDEAIAEIAKLRAARPYGWVGRETPVIAAARAPTRNHNAAPAISTARADSEDTQYGQTKRWSR